MDGISTPVLVIGGIVLVFVLFAIIKAPIKLLFKFLLNTALGFVLLLVANWLGGFIGISVAVNWLGAVIVGILGVPGVALLLLLRWLSVI